VLDAPQDLQSQPTEAAPELPSGDAFITQPVADQIPVPPAATAPMPQENWGMWPWLAAALLGLGACVYALHRRRSRAALAGVAELESFIPPEPVAPAHPRLPPAAVPRETSTPGAAGIVSTRLRPSMELEIAPHRCVVDDQRATIEFAITATNNGTAPARDVRIEVAMINAGPTQDQEIGRFFEQPAGIGEPIEAIPPMRSMEFSSSVSMPLDQVRAFEVAGRRLFVPLLAFNALFRWSGGDGQTSLSYLVGREGEGEKMAPFRLDLGPRIFRNLGARPHHMQVRR
jgi:hypothetical protein